MVCLHLMASSRGMSPTQKSLHQIRVEIPEPAFQALLKGAAKGSKVSVRLVAATYDVRKGKPFYTFTGSRDEVLLLRALLHAHSMVSAIEKALKG